MPLFIYQCDECGYSVEKFQHKSDEELDIPCEHCEDEQCVKQISYAQNRTWLNAKDHYNTNIKPDAERIVGNINKGKNKDFFDICGEE